MKNIFSKLNLNYFLTLFAFLLLLAGGAFLLQGFQQGNTRAQTTPEPVNYSEVWTATAGYFTISTFDVGTGSYESAWQPGFSAVSRCTWNLSGSCAGYVTKWSVTGSIGTPGTIAEALKKHYFVTQNKYPAKQTAKLTDVSSFAWSLGDQTYVDLMCNQDPKVKTGKVYKGYIQPPGYQGAGDFWFAALGEEIFGDQGSGPARTAKYASDSEKFWYKYAMSISWPDGNYSLDATELYLGQLTTLIPMGQADVFLEKKVMDAQLDLTGLQYSYFCYEI